MEGASVRMCAGEKVLFVFSATTALGWTGRGETSALGMEACIEGKEVVDPFSEVDAFREEVGRESSGLKGPIDDINV